METIIEKTEGKYKIKLYKHKKSNVTGIQKPYELIILINMGYDTIDYRETYHNYLNSKKEATDIINSLSSNKMMVNKDEKRILGKRY